MEVLIVGLVVAALTFLTAPWGVALAGAVAVVWALDVVATLGNGVRLTAFVAVVLPTCYYATRLKKTLLPVFPVGT